MAVASIDLTSLGQNLTIEQWYLGMLRRIGRQLDLEDEIDDFWKQEQRLGPLQRWLATLSDVVLESCSENVVIFVDEIDVVRSLPFQTDEFFAGIRDCYNRRSSEPAFRRLTFCLLGVATPSHLINDPHLTPFNIGRRVELRDFTPQEAAPLAAGLLQPGLTGPVDRISGQLLERILYWTGGHPYLTQRFCQAVAAERSTRSAGDVDRICGEIFLGHGAEEKDDNLLFVRESLLRGVKTAEELASLLRLYAGIRAGRRVEDDATDGLITALRLSGITKIESGALRVRNRIYRHVFDPDWVTASLPEAELRRHRAAFLAGVRRTLALSALVMSVVLILAWTALLQAKRATQRENEQRRLLYWADMKVAEQALQQHNVGLAKRVLSAHRADADDNFVWGYLWKQCDNTSFRIPVKQVLSAAFSFDNRYLALGTIRDGTIHICDARTGAERRVFAGGFETVSAVAFSSDGKWVAASGLSRNGSKSEIRVWSFVTGRPERTLSAPHLIYSLRFTPDNHYVRTNLLQPNERFWNLKTGRAEIPASTSLGRVFASVPPVKGIRITALSPDGRIAAISSPRGPIRLINTRTGRDIRRVGSAAVPIESLAISPDSRLLAGGEHSAHIWDIQTGREIRAFKEETGWVHGLAFSSDSRRLVTVDHRGISKLWQLKGISPDSLNVSTADHSVRLKGFQPKAIGVRFAFSPDASLAVSRPRYGSEITVWETKNGERRTGRSFGTKILQQSIFRANGQELLTVPKADPMQVFDLRSAAELANPPESRIKGHSPLAYSPDGNWLATKMATVDQGGTVVVQNLQDSRLSFPLYGHKPHVVSGAFSPDGRLLATGSWDNTVRVWDMSQRKVLHILRGHKGQVHAVAFAPDGITLATASPEGVIRFWDIALGREIMALDTGADNVAALAFTPDGLELKVAFGDGMIRSWFASPKIDIERLITEAQEK
jgi:WD40 repeat protein